MVTPGALLVHLCSVDEWDVARAAGERRPPSLAEVGFVQCELREQFSGLLRNYRAIRA